MLLYDDGKKVPTIENRSQKIEICQRSQYSFWQEILIKS